MRSGLYFKIQYQNFILYIKDTDKILVLIHNLLQKLLWEQTDIQTDKLNSHRFLVNIVK